MRFPQFLILFVTFFNLELIAALHGEKARFAPGRIKSGESRTVLNLGLENQGAIMYFLNASEWLLLGQASIQCFNVRTKNIAKKANHDSKLFYFFLGSMVFKFKLLIWLTHSVWIMATLINLNHSYKLNQVEFVNILSLSSKLHFPFGFNNLKTVSKISWLAASAKPRQTKTAPIWQPNTSLTI